MVVAPLEAQTAAPSVRCHLVLPHIYNEEKKKVFDALQEATAVSMTTDIWSSRAMQGYMTVTAHFISNDWKMMSHVLETSRMVESHTAENIASKLTRVMEEWKISDKISAVVTDNAANVVKAVGLLKEPTCALIQTCFPSDTWAVSLSLNLVVTTALKDAEDVKPVIDAVKEIVNFFHHSVKASDSLRELQSQQIPNQPHPLKPINDVPTRWNSTYYMLERYLELHTQVTTALCLSGRSNLCLGSETVDLIRLWIPDLKPFEVVTKEISVEKTTTTAKIIPIIQLLHEALTTNGSASRLAQELQKQLRARFPSPQCKFLGAASTFLDPRLKKDAFTDQSALQDVQDVLKGRMKPVNEQETRPRNDEEVSQATNSFCSKFDAKIQNYLVTAAHPSIKPNTEIRRLQEEDPIGREQDPLKWWKDHEGLFPQLHSLAKRYLAIPATSVPSERLFSTAGELVSRKRASLGDNNINMILFLNKKLKE
ncbi:Zinc finger bed domain-containing protein 1 [Plakobranchus ocellatus]|uniref:Zinc finger bed domain-containing protein 1 n=1 Tax=Plakobranchus ocellatus TaxID=259542 RepID=A0AAV4DUN6_9GAST|nr:Zinc finger bed domain-containing protein 1 [Plakobranchus ocellatus]